MAAALSLLRNVKSSMLDNFYEHVDVSHGTKPQKPVE